MRNLLSIRGKITFLKLNDENFLGPFSCPSKSLSRQCAGSKILSAGVEAIAGAGIEVENVRANFRGLLLNTIEGASRVLGASGSSSSNKTVAKRMLYR